MIDTAILAAIAARLRRALALPAVRYRRFVVGDIAVGRIDDERAARLAGFAAFRLERDAVVLDARLATCEARSDALATVALALRAEGALPAWRDERFAVAPAFGAPPLLLIERGAARYFGVHTWAAHINGIVRRDAVTMMWLARRSPAKAVDPGRRDNLVGGGIAAGLGVAGTLAKESWEEAGIDESLARRARPAGAVHVHRTLCDGLQRETIFVHDLALPGDFVPANQDGEAVEHRLIELGEAARTIAQADGADEASVDASLVVLDFLIRHGEIAPDQPGFEVLEALRHGAAPHVL
jgi:8-oxo-dGTP pyrophosphatase MutT (NUDIX family)